MFSRHWIIVQWMWKNRKFCPLPFILVNFPPQIRMLCLLRSKQNHNSQQQPSIGPNWINFKLVRFVFFAGVVRLQCSTQNIHQITHANSFPQFFSSSKIQRQKDAISPQQSLLWACAGLSRDTFELEKNNGFENCAKFHIRLWNRMIFLQTISILRKCYPSLFAQFHDTLLHIILIFPRLWFKKTHLGIHWIDWGK